MSTNKDTYITPKYFTVSHDKFDDFFKIQSKRQFNPERIDLSGITNRKRLFVLGEPGYGKSRLLTEILIRLIEEEKDCAFLELKMLKGNIKKGLKKIRKNKESDKIESVDKYGYYCSTDYRLSNDKIRFLLLDALDEVSSENVGNLLEEINDLANEFPNLQIIVTCRTHHIMRHETSIKELKFDYIVLRDFSINDVVDYLQANAKSFEKFDAQQIKDKIWQFYPSEFAYGNFKSMLNTPRDLSIFVSLLKKHSFKSLAKKTRFERMDMTVTEQLLIQAIKFEKQGVENFKQFIPFLKVCFERIALVMEIQRTNKISKEDLTIFEMDANVNISSQLKMEIFYDGTILKDSGDYLEFNNTNFQEFFAAKALSRMGRTDQAVFDLAVEQQLSNVYLSWIDVLSFLVEKDPSLVPSLINFACRENTPELFRLLDYAPSEQIDVKKQKEIFEKIMNYHLKEKTWLYGRLKYSLIPYFNPKKHFEQLVEILRLPFTQKKYYGVTLVANIIKGFYYYENKLEPSQVKTFKRLLFQSLNESDRYGNVMHREIIGALVHFCSIKEFQKFIPSLDKKNLNPEVVSFHEQVDPNDLSAIKLFVEALEVSSFRPSFVEKITTKKAFLKFFSLAIDSITSQRNSKLKQADGFIDETVIRNISEVIDEKLEEKLIIYILLSGRQFSISFGEIFIKLLVMLKSNNENLIDHVISLGVNEDLLENKPFEIAMLLIELVQFEDFKRISKKLISTERGKKILASFFDLQLDKERYDPINKKLFPERKRQQEINIQIRDKEETRYLKEQAHLNDQSLKDFLNQIQQSDFNAILTYQGQYKDFQKAIPKEERELLKQMLLEILKNNSPLNPDRSAAVTKNIFYNAVLILNDFDISPEDYRPQIIEGIIFVPYPFKDNDYFKILVRVSDQEKEILLQKCITFYKDNPKNDSLINKTIFYFKGQISSQIWKDFLISICENNSIPPISRGEAIEELGSILFDISFYRDLWALNLNKNLDYGQHFFVMAINTALLKLNDRDAFEWRINMVKKSKYKIVPRTSSGVVRSRSVSEKEGIGDHIKEISSSEFVPAMINLLEASFHYLKEDEDYYDYVKREIWDPVQIFFEKQANSNANLRNYIRDLKEIVKKNMHLSHKVHYFNYTIEKIEKVYHLVLSKPIKFDAALNKYLDTKRKQYLDISYPDELFRIIKDVINNELREWVDEGYYKFIEKLSGYKTNTNEKTNVEKEWLMQVNLAMQLENFLLKRGLRKSDITQDPVIYREIQKTDNKRIDLLVSYGAVDPVMIEVKLASNPNLNPSQVIPYRDNTLLPYMNQTGCPYGIYLVFLLREKKQANFKRQIKRLEKTYEDHSNIEIMGINAVKVK